MDEALTSTHFKADPEILKFQRALEDRALQHLIATREPAFWKTYHQELSERGNLLDIDGKETDKKPSHLILDLDTYKELETKTREALQSGVE